MSTSEEEKLLMAYLDGQMSATESSAFDASLTDDERDQLAAETRIEAGLAESLAADAECPDALWRQLKMRMRNQATAPRRRVFSVRSWGAAAAALLIASAIYFGLPAKEDGRLVAAAETVEELGATADVPANKAALEAYLRGHGFDVTLASFDIAHPESGHHATLLGARERSYNNEPTVELLYNCCGRPVRVVLAKAGTASAHQLARAVDMETVQRVDARNGFVAGVISTHRAGDLADVVCCCSGG